MNTFLSSSNTFDEEENIYVYQLHLLSGEQKIRRGEVCRGCLRSKGRGAVETWLPITRPASSEAQPSFLTINPNTLDTDQ